MKKIFLFTVLAIFAINMSAQEGLFLGARVGYGSSWLLNPYVMDIGDSQDFSITGSHSINAFVGYNLSESFGLETGIILNTHKQKYIGDVSVSVLEDSYEALVKMKTVDIPLFFKIGKGVYFEAGPIVSFISDVEYDIDYENEILFNTDEIKDVTDDFNGINICFSIGVGGDIELSENLFINFGGRIIGGLTDVAGVDALGDSKEILDSWGEDISDFKTNTAYAGLYLGIKYKL